MKTRVISAFVALAIAIIVLICANTWLFYLAVTTLTVGALYELFKAMGLVKFRAECSACFGYAAVSCMFEYVHSKGVLPLVNEKFFMLAFAAAIFCLYLHDYSQYVYSVPFTMLGLTVGVTYSFHSLIIIQQSVCTFAVVLTLAGAWLADSGAYFAGTFFGRNKLAPVISPKKTIEGVIGGAVSNGVLLLLMSGVYGSFINKQADMHYFAIFIAGVLCSGAGLLGDLSASVIKRQAGIKDYGSIMPGHGGVMDRFDSVILVAPFMYWLFSNGWLITT